MGRKSGETFQGSLKCWGYKEAHLLINFPRKGETTKNIHNIHESTIVIGVAINIPKCMLH